MSVSERQAVGRLLDGFGIEHEPLSPECKSERTLHGDCQEHDLHLVRQGRRGGGQLLRQDISEQQSRGGSPRASDFPSGKAGDALVVDFTVAGIPCMGLNGGPMFKHSEAFSFQIATDNQEETDRYWNAIVGNGGKESDCGWCKDKWGISWQITPRTLTEAMAAGGAEAKRAFEAMMTMKKIDVVAIEKARRG
jgi:predicted 3-demethylubiquinone-9 3-methyltransferase (glyoxalase superfamily)